MSQFTEPQGLNFHLTGPIPAAQLAQVLFRIAAYLQGIEPDNAQLQQYHDWWEHDGLLWVAIAMPLASPIRRSTDFAISTREGSAFEQHRVCHVD